MTLDLGGLPDIFAAARKAVLICHFNPDGDAVGSVTALWHFLSERGVRATVVLPTIYPDNLAFLVDGMAVSGDEEADGRRNAYVYRDSPREAGAAIAGADTIICLDFNVLSRTEYLEDLINESRAEKILIDHHVNPEVAGFDAVISRTDVSSTCELLGWVLLKLTGDVSSLSPQCAQSLFAGILTDTNNFSNSVYPTTLEMAAKLLGRGVDKDALQDRISNCYTLERMRLMGHLLKDKLSMSSVYPAAYMTLSNEEKTLYNFKIGDSEGFVNLPLAIGQVMISALFTQDSSGQYIRVSLRSKGDCDVNLLARGYFNGGGHKNASGGRLYMPLEDVPSYFEQSLKSYFGL